MTDRPRQKRSDRSHRPEAGNRHDTPDVHQERNTPARRPGTTAAPSGDTDKRPPAPGKATAAVTQEVRQVVNDLDERYRKSHSDSARDPAGPLRGTLGGPGNFGGGNLDEEELEPPQ
ncbi:MAG: hypothetical protein K0S46_1279 [Moraxellaceae bacterium]|jgi:hypothetical protein|nr:hypothetical protein [Moraxellaceae bacterium]